MDAETFRQRAAALIRRRGLPWLGRFADLDGLQMHYVAAGEQGPTVLLLHGLGGWSYTWRKNLGPLSQIARTIAVDLKGFGLSDKRDHTGYSLDDQTTVVCRFLNRLEIDRAVVVGHSMGGEIALRLALYHPDRVQALVLVNSAGYITGMPDYARRLPRLPGAAWLARLLFINRRFARTCLCTAYGDPRAVEPETVKAYLLPAALPGAAGVVVRVLAEADFGKTVHRISEIRHPTQIIWGERDPFTPVAHANRFHRDITGSRLFVFRHAGHLTPEEEADDFNFLVRDFIAEVTE